MQTTFKISVKPAVPRSATVSTPNFLVHTQPECCFNFCLPPTVSAAGLWALPPCCTLSVMFSRRKSSFKQPLPPCSLAFPGTGCLLHHHRCDGHWVSFMCTPAMLCPLSHQPSWPHCHLPASSAKDHCKGKAWPEKEKRKRITWAVVFSQEGESTNILSFGTGTQGENSQREKKEAKEWKHESPFTQGKWHLLSQPLTQLLWLAALLVRKNMYWKGHCPHPLKTNKQTNETD